MTSVPRPVPPLAWASDAALELPGSKSEANRVLVAAALSGREVLVRGATASDDVRHLVSGLAALGYRARFEDEARGVVRVGPRRTGAPSTGELFCGNAGTALRFLVSAAAVTPGRWVVTGDARMRRRPIGPLVEAWRALGVEITAEGGCPPVHVEGRSVPGGTTRLDPALSSQFLSSLLLVGGALERGIEVVLERPSASPKYAELTCAVLRGFGVRATFDGRSASAVRTGPSPCESATVGGDWSAFGVWSALGALTGSRVTARNLEERTLQPDAGLADVLEHLAGDGDREVDVAAVPDQLMNLAVVAARRRGTTRFTGAANLRVKECDRLAVTARELAQLGVDAQTTADGLVVTGAVRFRSATIDPEQDHRVAMAFALAGLVAPEATIEIAAPECVAKSYPTFWDDVEIVRRARRTVAVVGMRGAGKTTFARAFAERHGLAAVDLDARFVQRHGPIAAFVAARGWPAFRALEAELVRAALDAVPTGAVVDLGGGALEDGATRALLADRAFVVWVDAPVEVLRERVARDGAVRPSLTGADPLDELGAVAVRRRPHFESLAAVRVDGATDVAAQVAAATARLATFPGAAHERGAPC